MRNFFCRHALVMIIMIIYRCLFLSFFLSFFYRRCLLLYKKSVSFSFIMIVFLTFHKLFGIIFRLYLPFCVLLSFWVHFENYFKKRPGESIRTWGAVAFTVAWRVVGGSVWRDGYPSSIQPYCFLPSPSTDPLPWFIHRFVHRITHSYLFFFFSYWRL